MTTFWIFCIAYKGTLYTLGLKLHLFLLRCMDPSITARDLKVCKIRVFSTPSFFGFDILENSYRRSIDDLTSTNSFFFPNLSFIFFVWSMHLLISMNTLFFHFTTPFFSKKKEYINIHRRPTSVCGMIVVDQYITCMSHSRNWIWDTCRIRINTWPTQPTIETIFKGDLSFWSFCFKACLSR